MQVDLKINEKLGEPFKTEKGGLIQEVLVTTQNGSKEVFKLHAGAKSVAALVAAKVGDVISCKFPENFVFLQA